MDYRSAKIFCACALGALIGSLVALEMHHYFWWVGTLIGFSAGHLGYDWKQVLSAAKEAWHNTVSYRPEPTTIFWARRIFPAIILGIFSVVASVSILLLLALSATRHPGFEDAWQVMISATLCSLTMSCMLTLICTALVEKPSNMTDVQYERMQLKVRWFFVILAKHGNPLSIFGFWVWYALACGIYYFFCGLIGMFCALSQGLYVGIPLACRCCKTFFILVHSELRLLCGVDAAIGALVGFLIGSVVLGALAGGLLGLLNYELVSKRWLKCVPANV